MNYSQSANIADGQSPMYQIRVEGYLDPSWSEWLEGMSIIPLDQGETLLSGQASDQAALHGLLNKIRDLNLKLISMERRDGL
ncbi:MAG TPA: hypothetical protein VF831_09530 [Anaerolineales bacterium]